MTNWCHRPPPPPPPPPQQLHGLERTRNRMEEMLRLRQQQQEDSTPSTSYASLANSSRSSAGGPSKQNSTAAASSYASLATNPPPFVQQTHQQQQQQQQQGQQQKDREQQKQEEPSSRFKNKTSCGIGDDGSCYVNDSKPPSSSPSEPTTNGSKELTTSTKKTATASTTEISVEEKKTTATDDGREEELKQKDATVLAEKLRSKFSSKYEKNQPRTEVNTADNVNTTTEEEDINPVTATTTTTTTTSTVETVTAKAISAVDVATTSRGDKDGPNIPVLWNGLPITIHDFKYIQTLKAIKLFKDKHGRLPSFGYKDNEVLELALWCNNNISKSSLDKLTEKKRNWKVRMLKEILNMDPMPSRKQKNTTNATNTINGDIPATNKVQVPNNNLSRRPPKKSKTQQRFEPIIPDPTLSPRRANTPPSTPPPSRNKSVDIGSAEAAKKITSRLVRFANAEGTRKAKRRKEEELKNKFNSAAVHAPATSTATRGSGGGTAAGTNVPKASVNETSIVDSSLLMPELKDPGKTANYQVNKRSGPVPEENRVDSTALLPKIPKKKRRADDVKYKHFQRQSPS